MFNRNFLEGFISVFCFGMNLKKKPSRFHCSPNLHHDHSRTLKTDGDKLSGDWQKVISMNNNLPLTEEQIRQQDNARSAEVLANLVRCADGESDYANLVITPSTASDIIIMITNRNYAMNIRDIVKKEDSDFDLPTFK